MKVALLLRACRSSTRFDRFHRWEAGLLDDGFKPGYVPGSPKLPQEPVRWGGDYLSWEQSLAKAKVGDSIDFYVRSSRPGGELVTNIGIYIVSATEAIVCDVGEAPFTVRLPLQ